MAGISLVGIWMWIKGQCKIYLWPCMYEILFDDRPEHKLKQSATSFHGEVQVAISPLLRSSGNRVVFLAT